MGKTAFLHFKVRTYQKPDVLEQYWEQIQILQTKNFKKIILMFLLSNIC